MAGASWGNPIVVDELPESPDVIVIDDAPERPAKLSCVIFGCEAVVLGATKCGHVICTPCWKGLLYQGKRKCPVCKEEQPRGILPPVKRLYV